jgi:hypothetical protein
MNGDDGKEKEYNGANLLLLFMIFEDVFNLLRK